MQGRRPLHKNSFLYRRIEKIGILSKCILNTYSNAGVSFLETQEDYSSFLNHTVVIDVIVPTAYLGTLVHADSWSLVLENADVHDVAAGSVTKEMYVMACVQNGIQPNRRNVMIRLSQVISISRLDDIVQYL